MSRSIHTTHREFDRLIRDGAPDDEIQPVFDALRTKRRVKRAIGRERRGVPRPASSATSPDALPLRVDDAGPHVHHAASPEDVREVLRRLPPGTTDGLAGVVCKMGEFEQLKRSRQRPWVEEPDPHTGRLGYPLADGIWCGIVRGRYSPRRSMIEIYAHVVADTDDIDWPFWRWMLRYETLRTLLHEVGHHVDAVHRVARGRWRAGPGRHAEAYARDRERAWSRSVLEPYVLERYPEGDALMNAYAERVEARGGDPLHALRWGL